MTRPPPPAVSDHAVLREGMYKTLREVTDLCGVETAEALVRTFGGTRLWVPLTWRADHDLNRMGEAHARALMAAYGNSSLDVPRQMLTAAGRAHVIDRLSRQGLSQGEIARMIGCSQRSVSRAQNGHLPGIPATARRRRPVDPRQIDLEDYLK